MSAKPKSNIQFTVIKTAKRRAFASLIIKRVKVKIVTEQIRSYLFLSEFRNEFP